MLLDGARVFTSEGVGNPQGYVALWASSGTLEFKAIEIKEHPAPTREAPAGVLKLKEPIASPRVQKDIKPQYTAEAMRRLIQGIVMLDAVVLADGTVGETFVSRSLDPTHGLDSQATAAVKQWRFFPATRDGQPVAVLVRIELTFTLK